MGRFDPGRDPGKAFRRRRLPCAEERARNGGPGRAALKSNCGLSIWRWRSYGAAQVFDARPFLAN
jgi:hypothetical protein